MHPERCIRLLWLFHCSLFLSGRFILVTARGLTEVISLNVDGGEFARLVWFTAVSAAFHMHFYHS